MRTSPRGIRSIALSRRAGERRGLGDATRRVPLSRRPIFALLAGALAFLTAASEGRAMTIAGPTHGELCLRVADAAADSAGIPRTVMRAITLTETGRNSDGRFEPWPWTVNMEGAGHWFDSRHEALAYVRREQARGARSFDVGCFQVNHLWHGKHFASLEAMFDPATNAAYAARFLRSLHEETGDWSHAAGFYHSRTPEFFNRYRERFDRLHARVARELGVPLPAGDTRGPMLASKPPPINVTPRVVPVPTREEEQAGSVEVVAHSAGGVAIRVIQGHVSDRETRGRALMLRSARGPLAIAARQRLIGD
jgi:hypothetical protein